MIRPRLVEHDRDHIRTAYRVMADDRIVGTAVEIHADRVAPWRLTVRGVCSNLRRSSREIVEKTIERFAIERPDAFLPPPVGPTAWVPALDALDAVAADLRARGVLVIRQPMPDLPGVPTLRHGGGPT